MVLCQNLLPHYLQKKMKFIIIILDIVAPAIGKSEATHRTFIYHANLIWNYLSKLICTNATLACFKNLQTHLIPDGTVR